RTITNSRVHIAPLTADTQCTTRPSGMRAVRTWPDCSTGREGRGGTGPVEHLKRAGRGQPRFKAAMRRSRGWFLRKMRVVVDERLTGFPGKGRVMRNVQPLIVFMLVAM